MGELGDQIEARIDPAPAVGSCDPAHSKHVEKHGECDTALPHIHNVTEMTADDVIPTQAELATLRRVPAKIPWRGK